ncbi:MAG: aldose epimerase family protein [Planctomycetia bacterium]|nr:aldose epimerase family protein [Planctomycetia bacterium]
MKTTREIFGKTANGQEVDLWTLECGRTVAKIMSLGATLVDLRTPDIHGHTASVVLRLDTLDDYLAGHPCFGSICGRYANRIGNGTFTLDGQTYTLARNNGKNHLHGGQIGFHQRIWKSESAATDDFAAVKLTYVSPDGEEGYPGTLTVSVTYRLSGDGRLELEYEAGTDAPTVLNLTNHTYWNLTGAERDICEHTLYLNADHFLPVDAGLIPTGEKRPVRGTPLDFTNEKSPHTIGERITELTVGEPPEPIGGYDHCYCLNRSTDDPNSCTLVARVADPLSGRRMTIFSTEPGVQLYTANGMNRPGAGGVRYGDHWGYCLELQHYPDSPNREEFPTTQLRPGEVYRQRTIFEFA